MLFGSFTFFLGMITMVAQKVFNIFGMGFIYGIFIFLSILLFKIFKEKEITFSKKEWIRYKEEGLKWIKKAKEFIQIKQIEGEKISSKGAGIGDYEDNVKSYYSIVDKRTEYTLGYDALFYINPYTVSLGQSNTNNWDYRIFSIHFHLCNVKEKYRRVDRIIISFHKNNTLDENEVLDIVEGFFPEDAIKVEERKEISKKNMNGKEIFKEKYSSLYKSKNLRKTAIKKEKEVFFSSIILKTKESFEYSKEGLGGYKEQFISAKIFIQ